MIAEISVFIATLLLGPGVFFTLSRTIYIKNKPHYPVGYNDGIGDTIFLPLFNAVFIALYLNTNIDFIILITSIITAILFTSIMIAYEKNPKNLDWSKKKNGKLNAGGWYHSLFTFIQTTIIVLGLASFYENFYLWIFFIGYMLTVLIQYRINKKL